MRRILIIVPFLFAAIAGPALADQRDSRLEPLFARLQAAESLDEAKAVELKIWRVWGQHGDPEIEALMARGIALMETGHVARAVAAFDDVVRLAPDFAEGWNKRATAFYLLDEYKASVRDIAETLKLEPRHFGALSGMGLIYMQTGSDAAALKVFGKALEIHPNMPGIRAHMEKLDRRLKGPPT